MNAYIYQAALLCEECGRAARRMRALALDIPNPEVDAPQYDSNRYPKGPYPNGGGEADCPQHCDSCGLFLENPLTADGVEYVREQIALHSDCPSEAICTRALHGWAAFYADALGAPASQSKEGN